MIDKIKLVHFNEKEKFHEIYIKEEQPFYNAKVGVYNYDISFIRGYGETKEEALEDFKKKLKYLLAQYKKLEELIDSENLDDKIIQVNIYGEEVSNDN
jgi:hypothetical protein